MPLFETIPIDLDQVRQIARDHWNVEVGDCARVSQNHTFFTTKDTGERFVLRIIPDPKNQRFHTTELEVTLLQYLHENELPVCRAVQSSITSSPVVCSGSLILCLFTFAIGEPVTNAERTWMTNRDIVVGLGRWFARLHQLTRRFVQEQPELAAHARHWTVIHDGILAEVEVDERDNATVSDPMQFGLIHGDAIASNYFWDAAIGMPCMFDWDELQWSWFLYDLSAPIWAVTMLKRAGLPTDGSPVSQAKPELYTNWLIEGYESNGDLVVVDRDALQRMVTIRWELYRRFCPKALLELPIDHPIRGFCQFMTDFFHREDEQTVLES